MYLIISGYNVMYVTYNVDNFEFILKSFVCAAGLILMLNLYENCDVKLTCSKLNIDTSTVLFSGTFNRNYCKFTPLSPKSLGPSLDHSSMSSSLGIHSIGWPMQIHRRSLALHSSHSSSNGEWHQLAPIYECLLAVE